MPFDERFIDPASGALVRALQRAMRSANGRQQERRLKKTSDFWAAVVAQVRKKPQGQQRWLGGGRGSTPAPLVEAAWWTDAVGRKHWRVRGRRLNWPDQPSPFADHPLWQVYPDRLMLRERDGRRELLGVCPCGAVGPVGAIAWMGERCGPCHDRLEEGLPGLAGTDWPPVLRKQASHILRLSFGRDGSLVSTSLDGQIVRWNVPDRSGEVLLHRRRPLGAMAVSPTGAVAVSPTSNRLLLRRPDEDEWRSLPQRCGMVYGLAFGPDGRWLAVAGTSCLLIDLETGQSISVEVQTQGHGTAMTFGPDGSSYWLAQRDGADVVKVGPGGQGSTVLPSHRQTSAYSLPTCSPDGGRLAGVGQRNRGAGIHVCDLPTGAWSALGAQVRSLWSIRDLAFTHDGLLAIADDVGSVQLWDLAGRQLRGTLFLLPLQRHSLVASFSHDAAQVALGAGDGTIRVLPWRSILES